MKGGKKPEFSKVVMDPSGLHENRAHLNIYNSSWLLYLPEFWKTAFWDQLFAGRAAVRSQPGALQEGNAGNGGNQSNLPTEQAGLFQPLRQVTVPQHLNSTTAAGTR